MSNGGMNRTPRVFPDDDFKCCGWVIPKGVSPVFSFPRFPPNAKPYVYIIDSNLHVQLLDAQRSRRIPQPGVL